MWIKEVNIKTIDKMFILAISDGLSQVKIFFFRFEMYGTLLLYCSVHVHCIYLLFNTVMYISDP